jgi:hypothetical protein
LLLTDLWLTPIHAGYGLFYLIGMWRATSFEGRPHGAPAGEAVRIRAITILEFIVSMFTWTCLRPGGNTGQTVVSLAVFILAAIEVDLLFRYLSRLAARLPSPALARQFAILAPFYSCSILAGGGIHAVLYLGAIGSYRLRMLIALPGLTVSMGCAAAATMLLLRFSRQMRTLPQSPPARRATLKTS